MVVLLTVKLTWNATQRNADIAWNSSNPAAKSRNIRHKTQYYKSRNIRYNFVPGRVWTPVSRVTVRHSNHVAKELAQQQGCWKCL